MDFARWEKIEAIFHEARSLGGGRRDSYVESACGNDAQLRAEVLAMRAAHSEPSPMDSPVVPPPAEALPGEFGNYRLIRNIGSGGFGEVWLAEQRLADGASRQVAIKFIHGWASTDSRKRFQREIWLLMQLDHPFIARLYDSGVLPDGRQWFSMEYVKNARKLTDFCLESDLTAAQTVALIRDVCDAVASAHNLKILHRDLKPSNILVAGDGTPRLLDFGIGKQLTESGEVETVYQPLTPAYGAPEQFAHEPATVRSEVWALGVILYECLTGRHPFGGSGTGMVELSRAVSAGRPPRPSSLAKDPGSRKGPADWKDLDALCSKAMRKELGVRDRYLTVEALRSDLERYLNGQTLEARSPSWGYRISKWAERQRAGIALFVGGMILTSIASTVIQRSPTGGSPADAARQQALSALEQGKQALANKGPYPESYFERSIVLFKESGMSDSADCGDAHLELGLIQLDQKHLADAERETKTAVAIFDKLTQPDKERTEGARKQLAKITSEFAPGATP